MGKLLIARIGENYMILNITKAQYLEEFRVKVWFNVRNILVNTKVYFNIYNYYDKLHFINQKVYHDRTTSGKTKKISICIKKY